MQSLAGFKRLERNYRRLRLLLFQMYLRGDWSSVCPALFCNPRRNQVAPGVLCICSDSMTAAVQKSSLVAAVVTREELILAEFAGHFTGNQAVAAGDQ